MKIVASILAAGIVACASAFAGSPSTTNACRVTFNGKEWIERCIRSALESVVPTDVMVVDNGSGDGTPDLIKERFPDVILHENRENLGFAAANNIGFRHAIAHGYRFVYLLNQDAWVFPETFQVIPSSSMSQLPA